MFISLKKDFIEDIKSQSIKTATYFVLKYQTDPTTHHMSNFAVYLFRAV